MLDRAAAPHIRLCVYGGAHGGGQSALDEDDGGYAIPIVSEDSLSWGVRGDPACSHCRASLRKSRAGSMKWFLRSLVGIAAPMVHGT